MLAEEDEEEEEEGRERRSEKDSVVQLLEAEVHVRVHCESALSRVCCIVGSNPTRGSSFLCGKVTALGVLCYFALLFV